MISYLFFPQHLISFKDLIHIIIPKNQNCLLRFKVQINYLKIFINFLWMFKLNSLNHFLKIHSPLHNFRKDSNNIIQILLIFLLATFIIKIKYFHNLFCCNFQVEFKMFSIFFLWLYISFNILLLSLLLYQRILRYGHIKHGRGRQYIDKTYHLGIIKPWSFRTKQ